MITTGATPQREGPAHGQGTEVRVVQHNFLQEFNQLSWKISTWRFPRTPSSPPKESPVEVLGSYSLVGCLGITNPIQIPTSFIETLPVGCHVLRSPVQLSSSGLAADKRFHRCRHLRSIFHKRCLTIQPRAVAHAFSLRSCNHVCIILNCSAYTVHCERG